VKRTTLTHESQGLSDTSGSKHFGNNTLWHIKLSG